ncbi:MAG TPA: crotonase/enoyl-CoA hydratase family protein [Alphaproteobacteria bacterium]|jgi:enoyl-CoA hydratase/carnithine racemase|nr:crotonase/enoyl-CoA hydratase family protein [Alphaproteobacteria bacterium]
MTTDIVTYSRDGDIALIGLNRPDKRNALSEKLVAAFKAAVERAQKEAKAGVVYGNGAAFCAGLDLAEHVERDAVESLHESHRSHEAFEAMARGRIPFVAALHGAVIGGGFELSAAAHVRVADATSFFALPEGQRGIFIGGGGSVYLTRLIGTPRMIDLMLTGRVLSAAEAERAGAVQYLVEPGQALARATELAHRIARNAPLTNFAVINALPRLHGASHDDGLFFESFVAALTQATDEARNGLRAFLEKRAERITPQGTRPAAADAGKKARAKSRGR